MLARLRSFVRAATRRNRFEDAMADELQFHLDSRTDDLMRSGLSAAEAQRVARLEFGAVESLKEDCRRNRGLRWLDEARQDAHYALRMMRRAPVLSAAAIVSLALGIGANTAIFSLIEAVMFRSIRVDRPEQLYFIAHDPGPEVSTSSNYPLFEHYRSASGFQGLTAYRPFTFKVQTAAGIEPVDGQWVSSNYHAVVRPRMALGRGFSSGDDRVPAPPAAVISHEYWTTQFGQSDDVIGRVLVIHGRQVPIVGVTGTGFRGLTSGARADITLPMSSLDEPEFFNASDGWIGMIIVGRLADTVSEAQALSSIDRLFQQFVDAPANRWVREVNRDTFRSAALLSAARGSAGVRREYAKPLWMLMALVAAVLLVACANVANLLLARAGVRSDEIVLRLSLGAGRPRIVRQLLTESLLLAVAGATLGLLIAIWSTDAILSLLSIGPSPLWIDARVNVTVLAFTAVLALLTGIGFGLVPAFRSTRVDLTPALKTGSLARVTRRPALSRTLLIAQMALCVVLAVAAALLSKSISNLHSFDAGFHRHRLLLADVDVPSDDFSSDHIVGLYGELLRRLAAIPGVTSASLSARTPIDFSSMERRIDVSGRPLTPGEGVSTNVVTPDYFSTFGFRLIRGRTFSNTDRAGSLPVAVISEAAAARFFPDADPIGHTFTLGGSRQLLTVIGIVSDARHEELRSRTVPRMVYMPLAQPGVGLDGRSHTPFQVTASLQTAADSATIRPELRREAATTDPRLLVRYIRSMNEQIDATLVPERLLSTLSGWFGSISLLLACVGLYGVMAYNVVRRTREVGIRIALGARPRVVVARVVGEVTATSAIGIAAGLLIAAVASDAISSFLFGLTARDAGIYAQTAGVLMVVSLAAGFIPARHAATIDPVKALKTE